MLDQYFGTKELYQVTLRANCNMIFGDRYIEKGEPVLSFENITVSQLTEDSRPIMAKGGWGNLPHVIWEDRSEVSFILQEGVMNNIGMSLLFGAKMLKGGVRETTYIPKREGPIELNKGKIILEHTPGLGKPIFCYAYERDCIQYKVPFTIDGNEVTIQDNNPYAEYIVDYYYPYGNPSLLYVMEKERFNAGTFSLEGKFYTKDENEGLNVTNLLTMPKVRVVSSINLHLGEGVNPTVSTFNIIAMPTMTSNSRDELLDIVRLPEDVDCDV